LNPRKLSVLAICALPLVLAACGGGSDSGSSADQDQITAAINAAATSGDPAACTKYQTLKFTEQTSGDEQTKGQAAVQACEKDAANSVADKVDVTDIEVDGDSATAKAAVTGSVFDGQTIDIALVKEDGQWKLDEFKGFEDFDKASMVSAFKAELAKEGVPAQGADCVATQMQKATDEQVESFFTGSGSNAEQTIFGPCEQFFKGG
jgi:adenine-specific DNA methylase